MTIAEGGGRRAVTTKLRDMYLPTLKANFMVWPLVQIINFRVMPIQFQLVGLPVTLGILPPQLTTTIAIRLDSRYCLDSIPISIQCCRGSYGCSVSTSVAQYPVDVKLILVQVDRGENKGQLSHWATGVINNDPG
jgi:hypothetical protein